MLIDVRSTAAYDLAGETFLTLMIEPPLLGPSHKAIRADLMTSSTPYAEMGRDPYGNLRRHLVAPAGTFSLTFTGTYEVAANTPIRDDAYEHPPQEIPGELMVYTLPSRYCQSDLLTRMARSEFGHLPPGGAKVNGVADWVRERVEYRYGTTDAMTSAFDTATERIGVCRDFAHLVIAFCRALNIPARYVSGYALGLEPPDFHGYAQVYLGGDWHNVDATFIGTRPALLPIAVGRDAADVAMATLWGPFNLTDQTVEVREATG